MSAPKGVVFPVHLKPAQWIIGSVRATVKLLLIVLWLGLGVFLLSIYRFFTFIVRKSFISFRQKLVKLIAKGFVLLTGARIERKGSVPQFPFFLVSNHLSWLDSPVFMADSGAVFVGMKKIKKFPVIGFIVASFGTIFINRASLREIKLVGELLKEALYKNGEGVMVFPEGDTSEGNTVLPFRGGLLQVAVEQQFPVSAAVLKYETPEKWPDASRIVAWADWTPLFFHIFRFLMLPYYKIKIEYNEKLFQANDRKVLVKELHNSVSTMLKSV